MSLEDILNWCDEIGESYGGSEDVSEEESVVTPKAVKPNNESSYIADMMESCPANAFMRSSANRGAVYNPGTKLEYVVVEGDERLQGERWRDVQYPTAEKLDIDFYSKRLRKSLESLITVLKTM